MENIGNVIKQGDPIPMDYNWYPFWFILWWVSCSYSIPPYLGAEFFPVEKTNPEQPTTHPDNAPHIAVARKEAKRGRPTVAQTNAAVTQALSKLDSNITSMQSTMTSGFDKGINRLFNLLLFQQFLQLSILILLM